MFALSPSIPRRTSGEDYACVELALQLYESHILFILLSFAQDLMGGMGERAGRGDPSSGFDVDRKK